jgi:hypothetical protein
LRKDEQITTRPKADWTEVVCSELVHVIIEDYGNSQTNGEQDISIVKSIYNIDLAK